MSTNLTPSQTVQQLYTAFGRGDVPAILGQLHDNIDWHVNVDPAAPGAAAVPLLRARRGPREVGEFFQALSSSLEMHAFEPKSFMSGENEVAVRVHVDATVRPTGKRVQMEAIHHWTFDAAGKVTHFVDYFDTLAEVAAWDAVKA